MPAKQRGSAYKLADGRWGLRYYTRTTLVAVRAPSLPAPPP